MDPARFTVGWICALHTELAASKAMLDEKYHDSRIRRDSRDTNKYSFGRIGDHKIVLTGLVSAGTNPALSAASHMYKAFPNLRFILMVGIGGGIPSPAADVRLGDVVVSMPDGAHGGVIQHDSGKYLQEKGFLKTGALRSPPLLLQNVVRSLRTNHESKNNCIT